MPTTRRPVAPEDLYRLRQLTTCELSPDGRWVATSVDRVNREKNRGYSNLYLQSTRGGPLRQFTRGEYVDVQPRFSPDGKRLAFLSDRSGKRQVHLIPTDGGESWQLTKLEGDVSEFAWSPNSRWLCVVLSPQDEEEKEREEKRKLGKEGLDEPLVRRVSRLYYRLDGQGYLPEGCTELQLVDAKTGRARVLVKDGRYNRSPAFTADGRWVVFSSNKHPDEELEPMRADLWRVRTDGGGEVEKIPTHEGPAQTPAVSPDGRWIAFRGHSSPDLMENERNPELFVVPFDGGGPRNLSAHLDRPVENVAINDTWGLIPSAPLVWSPDSQAVFSQVTIDGNTEVYRFDLQQGRAEVVFSEAGVVLDFAVDFGERRLYCTLSDPETPGDLYRRELRGGPLKRLTRVNGGWLPRRSLGRIEELWVEGDGNHRIHGWVQLPPDHSPRKKYPGVLYIHGGPHVANARAFMHEYNYLTGLGYVVFWCNPRGSHGYGQAHVSSIAEGWGDKDYADLMRFTDHVLRAFPSIDPRRVGVTGGSYGGYMTNWIVGHTNRFRAAVTQRCVSNLLSFMGSSDAGYVFHYGLRSKDRTPWQDVDRFLQLSPMNHLVNCTTPTLVIHSENDLRCPIEQGEQVYVQLKLQGVETELIRFPQESHGLSRGGRTDRRVERLKQISGWFDKYLRGEPERKEKG